MAGDNAKTTSPGILPTPVNLCAVGLIVFFFLPWVQLLGFNASGYDVQKLGSYGQLVWLVPISAAATVIAGLYGQRQNALALLTGALPFLGLLYVLTKVGDQVLHALAVGAYLTLITSGVLLLSVYFGEESGLPSARVSAPSSARAPVYQGNRQCPYCAETVSSPLKKGRKSSHCDSEYGKHKLSSA